MRVPLRPNSDIQILDAWEPIYIGFVEMPDGEREFIGKLYQVDRVRHNGGKGKRQATLWTETFRVNGHVLCSGHRFGLPIDPSATRAEMAAAIYRSIQIGRIE